MNASTGAAALDQAQMVVYSTPPVAMVLDANQFAVFAIALAILIAITSAALVLGMRR